MECYRMCTVCREKKFKQDLFRVVKLEHGANIDLIGKAQGRGAYICKSTQCVENAQKRKALERSLKCAVSNDIYKSLGEMIYAKQ